MNTFFGKFIKGFITGGLSGLTVALASGVSFSTLEQAKHVLALLAVAFISGAIHGVVHLLYPANTTPQQ